MCDPKHDLALFHIVCVHALLLATLKACIFILGIPRILEADTNSISSLKFHTPLYCQNKPSDSFYLSHSGMKQAKPTGNAKRARTSAA